MVVLQRCYLQPHRTRPDRQVQILPPQPNFPITLQQLRSRLRAASGVWGTWWCYNGATCSRIAPAQIGRSKSSPRNQTSRLHYSSLEAASGRLLAFGGHGGATTVLLAAASHPPRSAGPNPPPATKLPDYTTAA